MNGLGSEPAIGQIKTKSKPVYNMRKLGFPSENRLWTSNEEYFEPVRYSCKFQVSKNDISKQDL